MMTLPAAWPNVALSRAVREMCDGPFGSSLTSSHYASEGPRVVRLGNIGQAEFRNADEARISYEHFRTLRRHEVRGGDLLVAGLGDENNPLGRACVAPDWLGPAIVKADCFRFRLDPGIFDHGYVAWALSSNVGRRAAIEVSRGSTRSRANLGGIASLRLPCPPAGVQRRISDFLDAETARIDALIAHRSRQIELLSERAASAASHLALRGQTASMTLKPSEIPTIGPVPDHWQVLRNKVLVHEVTDLSADGSEDLLTVSHITGVTSRAEKTAVTMFKAESTVGYKRCSSGDLVINTMWAWMGALGVARQSGVVSPAYGVYRFDRTVADPRYLEHVYRSPAYVAEMTRYSKGVWTSRLRLYPDAFLALSAPVPPLAEQREIVAAIDAATRRDNELAKVLQSSIALLRERRQAVITAAVTGTLQVPESPMANAAA